MQKPTITIAIPSYNKEKEIRRCIESAIKNTSEINEIVLIDNCSTDNTFFIAKEYEPQITCVRNNENLGMSGNFNRCIELCDTDWLMILHADDELLEGSVSKYRSVILKYPSIGLILPIPILFYKETRRTVKQALVTYAKKARARVRG